MPFNITPRVKSKDFSVQPKNPATFVTGFFSHYVLYKRIGKTKMINLLSEILCQ